MPVVLLILCKSAAMQDHLTGSNPAKLWHQILVQLRLEVVSITRRPDFLKGIHSRYYTETEKVNLLWQRYIFHTTTSHRQIHVGHDECEKRWTICWQFIDLPGLL